MIAVTVLAGAVYGIVLLALVGATICALEWVLDLWEQWADDEVEA